MENCISTGCEVDAGAAECPESATAWIFALRVGMGPGVVWDNGVNGGLSAQEATAALVTQIKENFPSCFCVNDTISFGQGVIDPTTNPPLPCEGTDSSLASNQVKLTFSMLQLATNRNLIEISLTYPTYIGASLGISEGTPSLLTLIEQYITEQGLGNSCQVCDPNRCGTTSAAEKKPADKSSLGPDSLVGAGLMALILGVFALQRLVRKKRVFASL